MHNILMTTGSTRYSQIDSLCHPGMTTFAQTCQPCTSFEVSPSVSERSSFLEASW